MNALRWIGLGLVLSMGLLQAKEPGRIYLAVPSAPAKCLFFSCIQLEAQPKPSSTKKPLFFTLWRSGYWDEKEPDIVVKNAGDWNHTLEVRARQTIAAKPEMSQLPPSATEFFVAVETIRAATLNQPLVLEPLFKNQHFVGWEATRHLNVTIGPDGLGPKERSRRLLEAMGASEKERSEDPGPWLKKLLTSLGADVQSARYYPDYNVFVFEAGGKFTETVELLFSGL